jgi:hypothetical protein
MYAQHFAVAVAFWAFGFPPMTPWKKRRRMPALFV